MKHSFFKVLPLIIIIILGVIIYSNALHGPFVFDDEPFIVYNTNIKDLGNFSAIWHALDVPARFITYLTFALNYHFNGLDVTGYHAVNIIIHLLNAMLVYALMLITVQPTRLDNQPGRLLFA